MSKKHSNDANGQPEKVEVVKDESDTEENVQKVSDQEVKIQEYKNQYLRALADYQNLLKRIVREREEFTNNASESLLTKLLPVLDDLKRAKETIHDKGIELIYNKLWSILETEGLERIPVSKDDVFDPVFMECIEAEGDGKRIVEIRAGYQRNGKVIRPVQVKVIK